MIRKKHYIVKITTLVLMLILVSISTLYAQINIRQENTSVNLKPPVYDSLMTSFEYYDANNTYLYKKYIGQRLFFKPCHKNNLDEFITEKESTLIGAPMPYEKTNIGQILSLNFLNARTKQGKGNLQKTYRENKDKYLSKFTIKTNLYNPIIINEKEFYMGKHPRPNICNNVNFLNGKSFLVLDVFSGTDLNNKTEISPNVQTTTESLLFKLLDENKDTLYWKTWSLQLHRNNHFIIQGYYDKQKSNYVGRQFIYRNQMPYEYVVRGDKGMKNDYERIIKSNIVSFQNEDVKDINTKQPVHIKDQDIWECVDISLIESDNSYDLYYIMKSNNIEIKIPIGEMVRWGFVLKDSYDKEQELKKLRQEEFEDMKKEEEAKMIAAEANRKKHLTSKYGNDIGIKIYNGQVSLGMTKEMCREAWGYTNSIVVNSALEVWIYSYGSSLTFNGDKLIQVTSL